MKRFIWKKLPIWRARWALPLALRARPRSLVSVSRRPTTTRRGRCAGGHGRSCISPPTAAPCHAPSGLFHCMATRITRSATPPSRACRIFGTGAPTRHFALRSCRIGRRRPVPIVGCGGACEAGFASGRINASMPSVTEIVSAVIPCLDEEDAIGAVVSAVLAQGVAEVVVVDGASRDGTTERAAAAGARVVVEPRRGYGRAVQAGLAVMRQDASIVVFLDGD